MERGKYKISASELQLAQSFARNYYNGLRTKDDILESFFDRKKSRYQFSRLKSDLNIPLSGKKILEIGCGVGNFLREAENEGLLAYGIEPSQEMVDLAKKLDSESGQFNGEITKGVGEKIGYPDNFFDIVASFQVLEHVSDPEKVISESLRVLKPSGMIYFVVPNYNSFWEGHYKLLWLPNFNRPLAKLYVRLRGKDPEFLDKVNYITPKFLKNIFGDLPGEIRNLGFNKWKERMLKPEVSPFRGVRKAQKISLFLRKLGLANLAVFLGKHFEWQYPIILMAKKNE